jgi:ABC-2 type transport system ATP-binding protein
MMAIETEGLYKYYGTTRVVGSLDLQVPEGITLGLLGPNGAGKTTTIGMLTTLVPPTAGHARVAGYDVIAQSADVRNRIGVIFQESTLDLELTALENLRFQAALCGLSRSRARVEIADMLEMLGLADRAKTPVRYLSGGLRRRLEIARGLLHAPRVLFLDEPTTGLDAQTRAAVWDYLGTLRREQSITILFTTHQLEEADHSDQIVIIDHGDVVTQGTPAELKSIIGADLVILRTEDDDAALDLLSERFRLTAELFPGGLRFRAANSADLVPRLCRELHVRVESVSVSAPTLDDVFLFHTGRAIRDEGTAKRDLASLGEDAR